MDALVTIRPKLGIAAHQYVAYIPISNQATIADPIMILIRNLALNVTTILTLPAIMNSNAVISLCILKRPVRPVDVAITCLKSVINNF